MRIHDLKILPEFYQPVQDNKKTFEIRLNDRDYNEGDYLLLREWQGSYYVGRQCVRRVSYVHKESALVKKGYVVLGMHEPDYETKVVVLEAHNASRESGGKVNE